MSHDPEKSKQNKIDHLLSTLAEECAEVIQRVTKAQRWGLDETQPEQPLNNAERINVELNDLRAMIEMLCDEGLPLLPNREQIEAKKKKVEHFMEYARDIGVLEREATTAVTVN